MSRGELRGLTGMVPQDASFSGERDVGLPKTCTTKADALQIAVDRQEGNR
jgi:hypothetical protein